MEIPDLILRNAYNSLVRMRHANTATAKARAVFGPNVTMRGEPELAAELIVLMEAIDRGAWTVGGPLFDPQVVK